MKVPFFDLKRQAKAIKNEILKEIENVIDECAFSLGFAVENFEKNFANYLNIKHVVALNNGTSALHLALRSLNIGENDEVIIPSWTFIATAWAVSYVGAKIVFADVDEETWQIDPEDVKRKITKRTKAIIGVHIYGQPFNINEILKIANEYNLYLIEDTAQAHGAEYYNKKVGTFGIVNAFSFYPSKNLGSYGEAGAVATNNDEIADRIKILRNQGQKVRYEHIEIGYNMRMEGFQGAVLNVKLKYLDKWNERRREIAKRYLNEINNPKIKFQKVVEGGKGVYHLFVIKVKDREKFINHLEKFGVGYSFHYPKPVHLQKAYEFLNYKEGSLPITEELSRTTISIPLFPEMTDEEVNYVINVINDY
ncbi:MAG: DegT/DnrJ/EryC1/StrS family aminotransferase [Candidatus Hydrothermia bacterium]|jgi:dTDP-4-amino-4,6-dideoxygalactose transaminase|nr:DegT/DnrJ/EryC1/StrS family aminotransferase [Candidatus Hydrothermia bacterium]